MKGDDTWGKLTWGKQPIVHRAKRSYPMFDKMVAEGTLKGKFKTPDNLTIITCHNYDTEPLLERNLKFLGLEYVTLKEKRLPFKYVYKIERVVEFLKSGKRTDYVLFCDAWDTIIRDDPQKIIDIFKSKDCELLFGGTLSRCGMVCMPQIFEWYRKIGRMGRYLNSGVYIGTWEFTLEVMQEVCHYITPNSLGIEEYIASGRGQFDNRLCKLLPNFPYGAPDQDILRFIHPNYYPRMQFDLKNELVYRN